MNTTDEFLDIVNNRDEVVGRATRREVHARKLLHRAVHILIFDSAGRVFLQKRSMAKDMAPGLWDSSCSGHVDSGESYDHAAVRELGEELGLKLSVMPKRWFSEEATVNTGWEFVWVYHLKHEGPFVLNADEIERGEWSLPADLNQRLDDHPEEYAPAFQHIWRRAMKSMVDTTTTVADICTRPIAPNE